MGNSVFQMLDFCSWNSQNHHDLTSLVMTRSDVYGFGIPWVLTEIWRYLGCVCHVISPNSYRISLILRRLLGYKNTSGKKGVQSVCGSSGCSVSAPALGAWPLVSVALCPPLAAAVPGLAALRAPSPAPQLSASQRQLCLRLLPWLLLWTIPGGFVSVSLQEPERRAGGSRTAPIALLFLV